MGADLVGYILVGPRKIKAHCIRQTKKEAATRIKLCNDLICSEDEKVLKNAETRLRSCGIDPTDTNEVEVLSEQRPDQLIDAFVEMWDKEDRRDMMARCSPDNPKEKIVVCGDVSWGDGPEEEEDEASSGAWWLADMISRLGLFEDLGIV